MVEVFLDFGIHARSFVSQRSQWRTSDRRMSPYLATIQLADTLQDSLDGVNIEINAIIIMQTLFGFDLGNYYRYVPSARWRQRLIGKQGRASFVRFHCWLFSFAGWDCIVLPERETIGPGRITSSLCLILILFLGSLVCTSIHLCSSRHTYLHLLRTRGGSLSKAMTAQLSWHL